VAVNERFWLMSSPSGVAAKADVPAGRSNWRLNGLEPGAYTLVVLNTGLRYQPRAKVEVEPGEVTVTRIDVPKAATVAGRVVDQQGQPARALANIHARPSWIESGWDNLPVNDDGTFSVEDIPVGRVTLAPYGSGYERTEVEVDVPPAGIDDLTITVRRKAE